MAIQQDTRPKNLSVESLASEVLELAKDHDVSNKQDQFGVLSPLLLKIDELIAAASTPSQHVTNLLQNLIEAAALRSLLHLNAIQSIPMHGSVSLSSLAEKTGAQASLLERLLRVLVGSRLIILNPSFEYAHTPLSASYASTMGNILTYCYDGTVLPMLRLPQYLAARGPSEPASFTHNPIAWCAGKEGQNPFEIVAQDPAKLKTLHEMMVFVEHMRPYTGFYDFAKLACPEEPERVVLVDIGGGTGHVVQKVLEEYQDILPAHCVVQDRKEVIELAGKEGKLDGKVKLMEHDYFAEQPVKHARAYHLRAVAHDLSDENLEKLLKAIVPAMASDSKILIADVIVPDRGEKSFVAVMDLMMMAMGGKERTETNFRQVLDRSGLRLDGVYRAANGWGIVEASRKDH